MVQYQIDAVVQDHAASSAPEARHRKGTNSVDDIPSDKTPEFLPMPDGQPVAPNVDSPAVDPIGYSPPQGDTPLGESMDVRKMKRISIEVQVPH